MDPADVSREISTSVLVAGFYFVPTAMAFVRRTRDRASILLLNLFLGWTLVGWIVALRWSLSANDDSPPDDHPS